MFLFTFYKFTNYRVSVLMYVVVTWVCALMTHSPTPPHSLITRSAHVGILFLVLSHRSRRTWTSLRGIP